MVSDDSIQGWSISEHYVSVFDKYLDNLNEPEPNKFAETECDVLILDQQKKFIKTFDKFAE